MKKQLLSGKWELCGYSHKNPVTSPFDTDICEIKTVGTVPGNVDLDLSGNGFLPSDLFMGMNITKTYDFEGYGWWYKTSFRKPENSKGRMYLRFDGVDTLAQYYLNGEKIGESENMFIPHEFDVTDKLLDENTLQVHIRSAMVEAHNTSYKAFTTQNHRDNHFIESAYLRKPAHCFGWDILPRAVSAGIFKDVYLVEKSEYEFSQLFCRTYELSENKAVLRISYDLDIPYGEKLDIRICGKCKDSKFTKLQHIKFKAFYVDIDVEDPYLWWPKGYGDPNVYDVTATIEKDGNVLAEYTFTTGIRTVELDSTKTTDGKNGKFRFIINRVPVMCRGSNWVPLDAFHSRDKERYQKALELCDDVGCNILRVWGGGVYEQEVFYDFCDRHGIMVWQDFMLACLSYPIDEKLQKAMYEEAEVIVRMLRNHPSIILWAGDNECDQFLNGVGHLIDCNIITRISLPQAVLENDPTRPYLPSSPYVSKETEGITDNYPEAHLWGVRDFYKADFYANSRAHFVSETGYHGCPARASLEKFITPEKLWPITDNDEWNLHSTDVDLKDHRTILMRDQIIQLFNFEPDNLDDFALASQYSQAEADKFFIERIRADKPNRSGIIWWNILDGWPQMSDAVVDYYYEKKKAYNYIKRSSEPFFIMADEIANWESNIIASNDTLETIKGTFKVSDLESGKVLKSGDFCVEPNSNKNLGGVRVMYSDKGMFLIEWEINGKKYMNHYLHGYPAFDFETYKRWNEKLEELYENLN